MVLQVGLALLWQHDNLAKLMQLGLEEWLRRLAAGGLVLLVLLAATVIALVFRFVVCLLTDDPAQGIHFLLAIGVQGCVSLLLVRAVQHLVEALTQR